MKSWLSDTIRQIYLDLTYFVGNDRVMNAGRLRRGWRAVVRFVRTQNELQELALRQMRPWEDEWLHWVRTEDGYRLEGSVLPRLPRRLRHLRSS